MAGPTRWWWRWTRRLLVLALLVGVLLGTAWWWLHSDYPRNLLSEGYAGRGYPGRLSVVSIEYPAFDRIVLRGLRIDDGPSLLGDDHPALVAADRVDVVIDLGTRMPQTITVSGLEGHLDRRTYGQLMGIIRAEAAHPPGDGPPLELRLDISGRAVLGSGAVVEQAHVLLKTRGAEFDGSATGTIEGKPAAVSLASHPVQGRQVVSVGLVHCQARVAAALDAVEELGLLPPVLPALRAWLPEWASADGSVIRNTPDTDHFDVDVRTTWDGGALSGQLLADPGRVVLAPSTLTDAGIGAAQGRLEADLEQQLVVCDATTWKPGPRLPIPASVPVDAVLKALPRLRVEARLRDGREGTVIHLTGSGRSQLDLFFAPDQPLRIEGMDLPLALAQPYLPAGVVVGGGMAAVPDGAPPEARAFRLVVTDGAVRSIFLSLSQGRFVTGGWTVGPVDAEVDITPGQQGWLAVEARMPIGRLRWNGTAAGGSIEADIRSIDGLLARLHGPARLPDLTGAGTAAIQVAVDERGVRFDLARVALTGAALPDRFREVAGTVKGQVTWNRADGRIDLVIGGQLVHGSLRILEPWYDLAERSPIFTASLALLPGDDGKRATVQLSELLVRAADASGKPIERGWSAQVTGNLGLESHDGTVEGLVDHADLAWINRQIPVQVGQISGDGALTFRSRLERGEETIVEGSFLPLNVDLGLGRILHAHGLTGVVHFTLSIPTTTTAAPAPADDQ